ncbi:hypothetical protein ACIQU6_21040 [Streptomyces sp. NPDC090442]|uniref:hypothetical protein n=1 Tax=Streptomyces sp. NPDC090442 TaxID=3365962 RepID=UPI00382A72C0
MPAPAEPEENRAVVMQVDAYCPAPKRAQTQQLLKVPAADPLLADNSFRALL